jgi:hypothetical protein
MMRDEFDDQGDFGATNAADIGATTALPGGQPTPRPPLRPSVVQGGTNQYPRAPRTGVNAPPLTPPPVVSTTRFCGTCGAPLEPGRPFCGQCGTPVSTSGVHSTAMNASPSSSGLYRGSGAGWGALDSDAPTVAEMPMENLYGEMAAPDDTSRSLRILIGVLCLVGSFATAVAAIVLALHTF